MRRNASNCSEELVGDVDLAGPVSPEVRNDGLDVVDAGLARLADRKEPPRTSSRPRAREPTDAVLFSTHIEMPNV